jgi:hypothetical protein
VCFAMLILEGAGGEGRSGLDECVAARTGRGSRSMTGYDRRSSDLELTWGSIE